MTELSKRKTKKVGRKQSLCIIFLSHGAGTLFKEVTFKCILHKFIRIIRCLLFLYVFISAISCSDCKQMKTMSDETTELLALKTLQISASNLQNMNIFNIRCYVCSMLYTKPTEALIRKFNVEK